MPKQAGLWRFVLLEANPGLWCGVGFRGARVGVMRPQDHRTWQWTICGGQEKGCAGGSLGFSGLHS